MIHDTKSIAKVYTRSWLFIDIISTIPYDLLFVGTSQGWAFRFPRLLKALRIAKLVRLFKLKAFEDLLEEKFHINYNALSILRLALTIVCKLLLFFIYFFQVIRVLDFHPLSFFLHFSSSFFSLQSTPFC